MINKLQKRILWVIQISLTLIILGVVAIYVNLSYKNTISSSTMFMDRIEVRDEGRPENRPEDMPDAKPEENPKELDDPSMDINTVDGVYKISYSESNIKRQSSNVTNEIIDIANKVSNKKSEEGFIGKYIYKVRKVGNNEKEITIMENESIINSFKKTIILTIVVGVLGIIAVYIIARKISNSIVKPVEETFEKQKQFISDASHELKTSLAVIEANADVLSDKVGESKWISYIQNEVQSMNKLVNDLLTLAKMEQSGKVQYQKFDLSKEVEMTAAVFESMIYEKKINLESNIKENVDFNGDKEDIKQVVSILLDNAVKHTSENNKIIINLNKDKSDVVIEVKNQGNPIPDDEKEKIFERFYRVDKARSRSEKRYGLGLAIAKGIVEKYNGNISVDCKNGYTSFIVRLSSK